MLMIVSNNNILFKYLYFITMIIMNNVIKGTYYDLFQIYNFYRMTFKTLFEINIIFCRRDIFIFINYFV